MSRKTRSLFSLLGFAGSAVVLLMRIRKDRPRTRSVFGPQGGRASRAVSADAVLPGHDAESPAAIPAPGWWQIAKRTVKKVSENELMSEAASVTFYALLALFPAITAIVSIYGLFADPLTIQTHLDSAGDFLPSGGMEIIREQVGRLTQNPASKLGFGAVIGIFAALWSANQGSKAMFSALNVVYGEHESRGFVRLIAVSLAFTAGGIVFLLIGIGIVVLIPLLFEWLGLTSALDVTIRVLRWPVIVIVLALMLSVLYRYGPSRRLARWRWVTWGGTFAAVAWIALSLGFGWYVANFGSYNKTYGSLGAIIGFMTWMWLSSAALLLGAQLNAELETQTGKDSTVGGERPQGRRGARAADNVAAKA